MKIKVCKCQKPSCVSCIECQKGVCNKDIYEDGKCYLCFRDCFDHIAHANKKVSSMKRQRDDKGNLIYKGDVLYDSTNNEFYYVEDPFEGVIRAIRKYPECKILSVVKEKGYVKRWMGKGI